MGNLKQLHLENHMDSNITLHGAGLLWITQELPFDKQK